MCLCSSLSCARFLRASTAFTIDEKVDNFLIGTAGSPRVVEGSGSAERREGVEGRLWKSASEGRMGDGRTGVDVAMAKLYVGQIVACWFDELAEASAALDGW